MGASTYPTSPMAQCPDPGEAGRESVDPPTTAAGDQPQDGPPARDAPHATWVEYAVHLGYDRAAAEREDRAALVELLTGAGQPAGKAW